MNRPALAALISPWPLPLSYTCVLAAYVQGDPFVAEPLLPGHLAALLVLAYMVTVLFALPLWLAIVARWPVSFLIAATTGAVIGIAVGSLYRRVETQLAFPSGFLELVGGLGGLVSALIFRTIAGAQSNTYEAPLRQERTCAPTRSKAVRQVATWISEVNAL